MDTFQVKLTASTIQKLWSETYNTDGKPDWTHLFPYYHPNVVFQDSIQKIEGKDEFKAMCIRLTDRCQSLAMEIIDIAEGDNFVIMDWKMTMSFKKSPSTPLFGSTKLTFHEDGRIIAQRDYYDIWGDIFNNIPHFNRAYRKFMHKFFG